jgi:hypothetical protein
VPESCGVELVEPFQVNLMVAAWSDAANKITSRLNFMVVPSRFEQLGLLSQLVWVAQELEMDPVLDGPIADIANSSINAG